MSYCERVKAIVTEMSRIAESDVEAVIVGENEQGVWIDSYNIDSPSYGESVLVPAGLSDEELRTWVMDMELIPLP